MKEQKVEILKYKYEYLKMYCEYSSEFHNPTELNPNKDLFLNLTSSFFKMFMMF